MSVPVIKIKEEANKIHDNSLDLWGGAFNFSHEKGLAEWLKNSIDAYIRDNISDKDQHVLFRFTDQSGDASSLIECIDYCGMSHIDIEKAFRWWGDPNAATRGMKIMTYGGHGNGGKFYMRQMFQQSYFVTYRSGKLNIFGFNEHRKYGFADGFENLEIPLDKALKIAGIEENIIPFACLKRMREGTSGFTVVKGTQPKKIPRGKINVSAICDRLKYHPQARRPLKFCSVGIIHNGKKIFDTLRMEDIEPLPDFEKPFEFEIPEIIELKDGSDIQQVHLSNKKYPAGSLILKTSSIPFGRAGRKADLNCIDIIGEVGVLASYTMIEVGPLKYYPQAQYIYGECMCPILEDPDNDCVANDREHLLKSEVSLALLQWISQQIDVVGEQIASKENNEKEKKDLEITDEFNQILNKWKNQFMNRLFTEVFGGPGRGNSTGGTGDEGTSGGENGDTDSDGGKGNSGNIEGGGGEGELKKKGSAMPRVLLSGYHEDPDNPGQPFNLNERHYAVYQRPQDVKEGIYWINTSKVMAKRIIDTYGVDSSKWRDYLFQRYVDIFVKETIYRLAKKEGGSLRPEQIDEEIMHITSLVYDKAANDLEEFLLKDRFSGGGKNESPK